jgi:hypothetical protein
LPNRCGTLFRYAEISDVERAADDLLACGQARTLKAEYYDSFVACLPKDILVAGAKAAGRTDVRLSWPKAKLIDYFLAHVPFDVAAEHCGATKFIALDDVRSLEFLLYLYFGKTEQDLKNFALRDWAVCESIRQLRSGLASRMGTKRGLVSTTDGFSTGSRSSRSASFKAQSAISSEGRIARAIMPPICAAVPPARSVSSSRSSERRTSLGSYIASVRRRNAASGWFVCSTER